MRHAPKRAASFIVFLGLILVCPSLFSQSFPLTLPRENTRSFSIERVTQGKNGPFMKPDTTRSFLVEEELTCGQLYGDDRCEVNFCECLRGIDEEWDEDLQDLAEEMCAKRANACEECGVLAEHCRSPVREW